MQLRSLAPSTVSLLPTLSLLSLLVLPFSLFSISLAAGADAQTTTPVTPVDHASETAAVVFHTLRLQEKPLLSERNAPPNQNDSDPHTRSLGDTVALLPWSYRNGKYAAVQSAREACNHLLLESGLNVFLVRSSTGAMPSAMSGTSQKKKQEPVYAPLLTSGSAILGKYPTDKSGVPFTLPTPEQMIEIGTRLQTRYVLAGRAQWNAKNVWIGVSNRTKSTCTIDLLIMDMASKHLVLEARNVTGDSTEKQNLFATVTSAVTLNPIPLLLPGSVTPQEQHAVVVATAHAMASWLKTERSHAALLQADESSSPAYSEVGSSVKFSTLVSDLHALHVPMHVTTQDEKLAAGSDGDLARLYALHDLNLDYREPNKLRLRVDASKGGTSTLLISADQRRFDASDQKKGATQDIYETPMRHLDLTELCGLLTPGIFEYTRARFVKEEKLNDANTVVYDLSYWGLEESSYYRVWIDPAKRLILKREWFDHNSQLKATYYYKSPHEIARHVWLPTRIEIENANHKQVATITLANPQVNQDVSTDLFAGLLF